MHYQFFFFLLTLDFNQKLGNFGLEYNQKRTHLPLENDHVQKNH